MPEEAVSLIRHLRQTVQSGSPGRVDVTLNSGATCSGQFHAIFDDGLAIMDNNKIIYVPISGLASVAFDNPSTQTTDMLYRAVSDH